MRVLPTHQILDKDGNLTVTFLALLEQQTVTFRAEPTVAQRMRLLGPDVDWSRHIFLGNEFGIPKHDDVTLHMFIHAKENMRGTECHVQLLPEGTVRIS
jgi:hypothetical protein